MLTRRTLLVASAAGAALFATGAWRSAAAQGADPTAFIVQLGNAMTGIVNSPGSYEERKRRFAPLVEAAVDVDAIGQYCLGRYRRGASPDQLRQYIDLFHTVLLNNIGGKIGQFQGVTFTPTTTTQRDGESMVGTVIRRPNQEPNNVQWVVSSASGRPRIIDVIAEGLSLRLTQRNDYSSFLSRHNGDIGALISAMRQQVAG